MKSLPLFCPPKFLKNPHLQTILPRFIVQNNIAYQREYHQDSSCQTFVAYDFVINNKADEVIVVMFCGLEGSSHSPYAQAFANWANRLDKNIVIVHYRGCGGMTNTGTQDYHAGDIDEIDFVLAKLAKRFATVYAVGVSLGGNMLARYLGITGNKANCQKAVIISAPVDLLSASQAMYRLVARHVYTPFLLKTLIPKACQKSPPSLYPTLQTIKRLDVFDDVYTAPRHGFKNAQQYYQSTSALPVLQGITQPTLIISAKDDPFLGKVATVDDISKSTTLLYSQYGGHVGFIGCSHGKFELSYLPKTAFLFFDSVFSSNGV